MSRILLVDDSAAIRELILGALKPAGHQVRSARDADAAVLALRKDTPELILLDIDLPGLSGLQLLDLIRREAATSRVPVIMLTVKAEEATKVQGLKLGADDYVVKPFSTNELLARVEAVLRRTRPPVEPEQLLEASRVRLDLSRREAAVEGDRVVLTPVEFDLLAALMRRKGFIVGFEALTEALSKGGKLMSVNSLYVHVNNLRAKLGLRADRIETVHGTGYRFLED